MLTKELLRVRVKAGVAEASLLKATPAINELAEFLLTTIREHVGKTRDELDDATDAIAAGSRTPLIAKGLVKIALEHATFSDPAGRVELRAKALAASARSVISRHAEHGHLPMRDQVALILKEHGKTLSDHQAQVAAAVGMSWAELCDNLYADLPHLARLATAPAMPVRVLLDLYNMGLVQGLLLTAESLDVTLVDADQGLRRRLLKQLRFHRLLAQVHHDHDGGLRMEISGPRSVLEGASGYGLQLALWFPALATAKSWHAVAQIRPPQRPGMAEDGPTPMRRGARLELSQELGLLGDTRFLAYVPEELTELVEKLKKLDPQLQLRDDAPLLQIPGGELLAPDMVLYDAHGLAHPIELFHRWHQAPLERRLQQADAVPQLLLGVDRALAKNKAVAPLLAHPAFVARGFLFSGFPAPRALREVLTRAEGTFLR